MYDDDDGGGFMTQWAIKLKSLSSRDDGGTPILLAGGHMELRDETTITVWMHGGGGDAQEMLKKKNQKTITHDIVCIIHRYYHN